MYLLLIFDIMEVIFFLFLCLLIITFHILFGDLIPESIIFYGYFSQILYERVKVHGNKNKDIAG